MQLDLVEKGKRKDGKLGKHFPCLVSQDLSNLCQVCYSSEFTPARSPFFFMPANTILVPK